MNGFSPVWVISCDYLSDITLSKGWPEDFVLLVVFENELRQGVDKSLEQLQGKASSNRQVRHVCEYDSNCLSSKCFWKVFNIQSASCAGSYILNKCVQHLSNTKSGLIQLNSLLSSGNQLSLLLILIIRASSAAAAAKLTNRSSGRNIEAERPARLLWPPLRARN